MTNTMNLSEQPSPIWLPSYLAIKLCNRQETQPPTFLVLQWTEWQIEMDVARINAVADELKREAA